MNSTWLTFLATRGARVENGVVADFGDATAELAAVASESILADLSALGVIAVAGADARAFLHAQLSCDVDGLQDTDSAYGAYCSPKGRVLANFLLWQESEAFHMLLPRALVRAIQMRLQMFVLRSKVTLADRSNDLVVLGISGSMAARAVASAVGAPPQRALQVARGDGCTMIALSTTRVVLAASVELAPTLWDRLTHTLKPAGTRCWEWLEISNGLPWITPATQDRFVPQMANLELIGAVNFQKGCYPGQEIVARLQYRGTPKRRLHLAHVRSDAMPAPGQELFSDDSSGQEAGMVVNAAPAPGGGFDVLAVVQTGSATRAKVHLGSASGPELRFRALPYPVT